MVKPGGGGLSMLRKFNEFVAFQLSLVLLALSVSAVTCDGP